MKIITIANNSVDYTLLKANRGIEVFMNPARKEADNLVNCLAESHSRNADETFLILCNDFDKATFRTLDKILGTLGITNQSLVLFGINTFEVGIINRLKNIHKLNGRNKLDFFRATYAKSYWNNNAGAAA